MFEDAMRQLRRLSQGVRVEVDVQLDDEGYYDRICPSEECNSEFKVLFEDWREKVKDEVVYCPICRFEADSGEWNTEEQQRYLQEVAVRYMRGQLDRAFSQSARRFDQRQSGGFITMSMSYSPGPMPTVVPAQVSDLMRQTSTCEACGCRYSSVGAAFFCPACGHNSAESTFDTALDVVRKTIDSLPLVKSTITEAVDADTAANSVRQMVENSLVKLVSSFQRFAEARFDKLPNRSSFNPRRNLFQNLTESNDLWNQAIGARYDSMLQAGGYKKLGRYFQRRHLLAHTEGIVDQAYIDRSGDTRYSVGQRLVIRPESVVELAALLERLAGELRRRT